MSTERETRTAGERSAAGDEGDAPGAGRESRHGGVERGPADSGAEAAGRAETGAGPDVEAEGGASAADSGDSGDSGDDALGPITRIVEAALLVAARPLALADLDKLFAGGAEAPGRNTLRQALARLDAEWAGGCLELQEVATGYRAQVRNAYEPWIARLWDEKPPRYSRALLETLSIIAYRQPMTRSEIEEIRGVTVSSQIIRTLTEREWIRVVGHRETPGRPAMYGTTREFLDYFNLKTLDQLPPISDIRDLEGNYLELGFGAESGDASGASPGTGEAGATAAAAPPPEPVDGGASGGGSDADDSAAAPGANDDAGVAHEQAEGDAAAGDETPRQPADPEEPTADDEEDPPCTPVS